MTALVWAAYHGELEQVQQLVDKLADVNVVDEVPCFSFCHSLI